jgi:hypothetical protein
LSSFGNDSLQSTPNLCIARIACIACNDYATPKCPIMYDDVQAKQLNSETF